MVIITKLNEIKEKTLEMNGKTKRFQHKIRNYEKNKI